MIALEGSWILAYRACDLMFIKTKQIKTRFKRVSLASAL